MLASARRVGRVGRVRRVGDQRILPPRPFLRLVRCSSSAAPAIDARGMETYVATVCTVPIGPYRPLSAHTPTSDEEPYDFCVLAHLQSRACGTHRLCRVGPRATVSTI